MAIPFPGASTVLSKIGFESGKLSGKGEMRRSKEGESDISIVDSRKGNFSFNNAFGNGNNSTPIKKRGSTKGITKSIPNSTSLAIAENDQGPTRNQLRKARRQIIRYR